MKLNRGMFLLLFFSMLLLPANAQDVGNWSSLKSAIEDSNVEKINFTNNVTIDNDIQSVFSGNKIFDGNNFVLDGNNKDGFTVSSGSNPIIVTINDLIFSGFSKDETPSSSMSPIIYVGYGSTLKLNNTTFKDNKSLSSWVIDIESGTLEIKNSQISNNSSESGIIKNNTTDGETRIENSTFDSNTSEDSGGVIYSEPGLSVGTKLKISDSNFINNKSNSDSNYSGGGAIFAAKSNVSVVNANFTNNIAAMKGGAIYTSGDDDEDNQMGLKLTDSSFIDNKAGDVGGAIFLDGGYLDIVANQKDVEFTGNVDKNGSNAIFTGSDQTNYDSIISLNTNSGKKIVFNDAIDGFRNGSFKNTININQSGTYNAVSGTIEFNNDVKNHDVNLYNGTLKFGSYNSNVGNFDNTVNFDVYGGNVDLVDNNIRNTNLGNLTLQSDLNLAVDANFEQKTMDTITVNSFNGNGKNINISNVNILAPTTENEFSISPLGSFADESVKSSVVSAIKYTAGEIAYSPIYKYNATFDADTAMLNFKRCFGGNPSDAFNPAVLAGAVGAQIGSYLTQLNTYEQAFGNQDMLMAMTRDERTSMKFANKYASTQGTGEGGVITFDPNQIPEQTKGAWFRPYATFEGVSLNNGPSVRNIGYGSLFGGDTGIIELSHGWDAVYSVYAGYNGSNQNYSGVSINQNGGTLGVSGTWYKGNFFTGLTANVGASVAEAHTMYGSEDFTMLATGIASKTGYNFELADGKFIIQPNYLMSYTFVNTFDYTNAAGVRIDSDPLHAIQIAPGLKFIGNLKNGWQPYVALQMVWNIMDKSRFKANNVSLPDMSVDPYFQYGLGLQKRVGDRFTGFGQAMIRNGGRNGIALSFGFRWALGK